MFADLFGLLQQNGGDLWRKLPHQAGKMGIVMCKDRSASTNFVWVPWFAHVEAFETYMKRYKCMIMYGVLQQEL